MSWYPEPLPCPGLQVPPAPAGQDPGPTGVGVLKERLRGEGTVGQEASGDPGGQQGQGLRLQCPWPAPSHTRPLVSSFLLPRSAKAKRRPREAEMASTSRCPRPGRSPRGSGSSPQGADVGTARVGGGVSTRGWQGEGGLATTGPWERGTGRWKGGLGSGRAFRCPSPPPSCQGLDSTSTSLFSSHR